MNLDEIARLREAAEKYRMACDVGEAWQVQSAQRYFEEQADPEVVLRLLDERDALMEHLTSAWGVIANAGGWPQGDGSVDTQHPDWHGAAVRWRDEFHRLIGGES